MRVATWNVNSVGARLPRLLPWLEAVGPDVVALQETKTATFPTAEVAALGYDVAHNGDGRWNGAAILSRVGLEDVALSFLGQPGYAGDDEDTLLEVPVVEARAVGATCGGLRFWSLYVPNGRSVDHAHYRYKLAWLASLRTALAPEVSAGPFVVTGDFNVAPTDADVWDIADFSGSTHVTAPERQALADLQDLGLRDVLPRALKYDTPFTYFDYRAGMFHKNKGMRIDLVYVNELVTVTDAYVDREARKGTGPSDHAPVVVDVDV